MYIVALYADTIVLIAPTASRMRRMLSLIDDLLPKNR